MPAPLILARTFKDAHTYAQDELGLKIGHYRVVNAPGTLKAVRNTTLHLVPGWDKRPDRFGMKAAMRFGRNEIVDVAEQRQQEEALERGMPTDQVATIGTVDITTGTILPVNIKVGSISAENIMPGMISADRIVGGEIKTEGTDFFDAIVASEESEPLPEPTCVDCGLTPCDDECKSAVAAEAAAQVAQDDEPEPVVDEKPKKAKRRTRCKSCGTLHFKDEACPPSEDA